MSDPTTEFFAGLGRRGHEPLLEGVTGTIRFDLEHEHGIDRWFVLIDQGDLHVSREEREAGCVWRTSRALFDRFASGEQYVYAAWARNALRVEGNVALGYVFLRVLPGPPGAHHPRAFAGEGSRSA